MFFGKSVKIPDSLKKVGDIFYKNGFSVYLVGGAVRDMIMGKDVHDYDLATDATPEQVMSIFKKVIPTGIQHGTVTIHIYGMQLETTTFRTEADYSDGRHPDKVEYARTIEEDLSRRDFTMNAIAAALADGSIKDPFDGMGDIKRKIIRTVGNPLERFGEDGLRPVRAIRFAGQLGFTIEEETLKAISNESVINKIKSISVERFHDEFCKIMKSEKPSVCLRLLEDNGLMDIFIPEFKVCRGCIQGDKRGFHEFDVADHNFYACDGAPKNNLIVRLAAFYHDIGKPESKTTEMIEGNEIIHFHGHELMSEKKCLASMKFLKFSNEDIKKVTHLVRNHMFFYESSWTNSAVRRFIIRIGLENLDDLVYLRLADIHGMHNVAAVPGSPSWNNLLELKDRIAKLVQENSALSLKDLKVNGNDLMGAGIPKGPHIGKILSELFETVTDSPEMNDHEKLMNLAKNLYEQKYGKI
ncbi:CCA tRNA nucleotidyltransferase [Treponema sp.]|uniref:CCA tRNA nucleotidyltransferase n=1 Tax=Treponema sp. TaxID=166 RepID=UPI00298DF09B|nr:HD domain-containing protein [Treponema sp.]MCQ2241454.1 HD domain-containing protein [Treponema sp.]